MSVLRKAHRAAECYALEQLPNIGHAMAQDLRRLGVGDPQQLAQRDGWDLYLELCRLTKAKQDPCVLDTFMAACEFMRGAAALPWWSYTARRKQLYTDRLRGVTADGRFIAEAASAVEPSILCPLGNQPMRTPP